MTKTLRRTTNAVLGSVFVFDICVSNLFRVSIFEFRVFHFRHYSFFVLSVFRAFVRNFFSVLIFLFFSIYKVFDFFSGLFLLLFLQDIRSTMRGSDGLPEHIRGWEFFPDFSTMTP